MAEVRANGVRLHVQSVGEGPPVLFLHGLVMDNLSSWYFSAGARVAQAGFRSVLVDLRGHGRSERPASGYRVADLLADLIGALDALGIEERVRVVGNSFGGQLATAFAVRHPDRVAGLALVDAHLGREGWADDMVRTLSLQGQERDATIAHHFQDWLGRHSARKRNRLATTAQALVYETSLLDDLRASPGLRDEDLAGLTVPVIALYGETSDLVEEASRIRSLLPDAQVEVLEGASHSLMWERTEILVTTLLAWLEGTRCAS